MFDVTNFLVRWLFLCNLVRDMAETQTLPFFPYQIPPDQYQQQHQHQHQHQPQPHQHPPHPQRQILGNSQSATVHCEEEWKEHCLRGIASYPPGYQRLLVIDAMRAELVNKLYASLQSADNTLSRYQSSQTIEDDNSSAKVSDDASQADTPLDADLDIWKEFDRVTKERIHDHSSQESLKEESKTPLPTLEEARDAQKTIRTARDYLPQLVSMVLKSPPATDPNLLNPVEKLRKLMVDRCVEDANWGIDLCWLLEAEVGRAWKTLFEHRQRTGRRLIIVLPADKAAVLAKIGTEKREAFDLLQATEHATAYGYPVVSDNGPNTVPWEAEGDQSTKPATVLQNPQTPCRLPSSLSLRRCSHYGDTMHFIDRLTKISLDMRRVPTAQRNTYLQENLKEMNRRIRRRMVTQGDFSLDIEDNRRPDEWPQLSDLSWEMLQYSVHLPLDPKQHLHWPGGESSHDAANGGVARVLNIVAEESRILSSRERCPFLIHVEVADTSLTGNDSRLYALGAPGLGTTVEEALSMSSPNVDTNDVPLKIPNELLQSNSKKRSGHAFVRPRRPTSTHSAFVRGGSQSNGAVYHPTHLDHVSRSHGVNDYRTNNYWHFHNQMAMNQPLSTHMHSQDQRYAMCAMSPAVWMFCSQDSHSIPMGEVLLDKIFGKPWTQACEEIRQKSPFGKTEGWRLASFIVKAGEDIRREALVMQIITDLSRWFREEIPQSYRPHLRPYTIMCVGGDAGLVECLSNTKSIDEVKKSMDGFESLRDYFIRAYGPPKSQGGYYQNRQQGSNSMVPQRTPTFEEAQENFLRSLVGYSLVCHILQIKDRHNANILIDRDGHIVHIDFGFVLGDTPKMSKLPLFSETAPFKLSEEFWDVLGGWNVHQGGLGVRFCSMFEKAFACASAHTEEITSLVEATMLTLSQSPRQARYISDGVRQRLQMRGPAGSKEQKLFIMDLVNKALTNWGTSTYDWLQRSMNGYQ